MNLAPWEFSRPLRNFEKIKRIYTTIEKIWENLRIYERWDPTHEKFSSNSQNLRIIENFWETQKPVDAETEYNKNKTQHDEINSGTP